MKLVFSKPARRKGFRYASSENLEPRVLLSATDIDDNGSFALADANFADSPLELTGGDTQDITGTVNRTEDKVDGLKFKVAADAGTVVGTITVNAPADDGQAYTVTLYSSSHAVLKSQVVNSSTPEGASFSMALAAGKSYYIGIAATKGSGDIAYDLTASLVELDADHNGSFALADANYADEDPADLSGGDTQAIAGTVNKATDPIDGLKFKVAPDAGTVIGTISVNEGGIPESGHSYTVTLYNSNHVPLKSQVVTSHTSADASFSVALTAGKSYYIGVSATSGDGDIAYDLTASLTEFDADHNGSFALADANFSDDPLEITGGDTQAIAGTINKATDPVDGLKFKVASDAGNVTGTITVNEAGIPEAGHSYTVTLYNSSHVPLKSQVVTSHTSADASFSVALTAGKSYYIGVTATSGDGDIAYDLTASLAEFDADHNGSFALADANFKDDPLEVADGDTQAIAGTVNKATDPIDGVKFKVSSDGKVNLAITLNAALDNGSYTITLYSSSHAVLKTKTVTSSTEADATLISASLAKGTVYYVGIEAKSGEGDLAYDVTASFAAPA